MDHLLCKACGTNAVQPMPVELRTHGDDDASPSLADRESRFFTCQLCGDNWLTIRETEGAACTITFVHQMGMTPALKRVAEMATPALLTESAVAGWDYFVDDDPVDEVDWFDTLATRRRLLRSSSLN